MTVPGSGKEDNPTFRASLNLLGNLRALDGFAERKRDYLNARSKKPIEGFDDGPRRCCAVRPHHLGDEETRLGDDATNPIVTLTDKRRHRECPVLNRLRSSFFRTGEGTYHQVGSGKVRDTRIKTGIKQTRDDTAAGAPVPLFLPTEQGGCPRMVYRTSGKTTKWNASVNHFHKACFLFRVGPRPLGGRVA